MKTISRLIQINFWLAAFSVMGYLTLVIGILLQCSLGVFQLACYLYLLTNFKKCSQYLKAHLLIYGFITTALLVSFGIDQDTFFTTLWLGSYVLVAYFIFILYQTKKIES